MLSGAMPNDNGGTPNQISELSRSAFAIAFVSATAGTEQAQVDGINSGRETAARFENGSRAARE
jgi:hypothetical protein